MQNLKNLFWICSLLSLLASCQKEEEHQKTDEGFKAEAALKFKGTLPAVGSLQLQWNEGQEIGIVPLAAEEVSVKSAEPMVTAVKYIAASSGSISQFSWTDKAFVPDSDIPVHRFAAFSPYSQNAFSSGSVRYELSQTQTGDMSQMPCFAYSEISSPIEGATVLMKFAAKAAIVSLPKVEGATKVVLSVDENASPLCGEGILDVESGEVTVGTAGRAVEYDFGSDPDQECRFLVWPGNHEGTQLHAVYTTVEGSKEVTFDGVDLEAGKAYMLTGQIGSSNPSYSIDIASIDFSESFIYEAKDPDGNVVAIICKEYLKASNQQAIVVYGTKKGNSAMVMDSSNPEGLVARVLKSAPVEDYVNYTDVPETEPVHGGTYSFNSDVMDYITAGNSAALPTVYATYDSEAQVSVVSYVVEGNVSAATLTPRTFTLADRGDTKAYKLVKVGRQIWFAENVETLKYSDGTSITKAAKAAELFNTDEAAYVNTASSTNRILYNVAAATSSTFTPAGTAWKIPTEGDFKNLASYVAQSRMLTSYKVNDLVVGNNITCFSITVRGRVTNKGWLTTEDANGDPWFCCSTEAEDPIKQKCLVVRMHEAKASDAPSVNSGQNKKFGYWVRLMRGLY